VADVSWRIEEHFSLFTRVICLHYLLHLYYYA
jgi:hypothetical protein